MTLPCRFRCLVVRLRARREMIAQRANSATGDAAARLFFIPASAHQRGDKQDRRDIQRRSSRTRSTSTSRFSRRHADRVLFRRRWSPRSLTSSTTQARRGTLARLGERSRARRGSARAQRFTRCGRSEGTSPQWSRRHAAPSSRFGDHRANDAPSVEHVEIDRTSGPGRFSRTSGSHRDSRSLRARPTLRSV